MKKAKGSGNLRVCFMKNHKLYGLLSIKMAYIKNTIET